MADAAREHACWFSGAGQWAAVSRRDEDGVLSVGKKCVGLWGWGCSGLATELGCPCVAIHRHTYAHLPSSVRPVPRRSLNFSGILF